MDRPRSCFLHTSFMHMRLCSFATCVAHSPHGLARRRDRPPTLTGRNGPALWHCCCCSPPRPHHLRASDREFVLQIRRTTHSCVVHENALMWKPHPHAPPGSLRVRPRPSREPFPARTGTGRRGPERTRDHLDPGTRGRPAVRELSRREIAEFLWGWSGGFRGGFCTVEDSGVVAEEPENFLPCSADFACRPRAFFPCQEPKRRGRPCFTSLGLVTLRLAARRVQRPTASLEVRADMAQDGPRARGRRDNLAATSRPSWRVKAFIAPVANLVVGCSVRSYLDRRITSPLWI